MADTELVIRINGDIKDFTDKLEKAKESTEKLEDSLKTTAEVSAAAFLALSAVIGVTTAKYAEHESAVRTLTLALQNQGLYSKDLLDSYQGQAEALAKLTGIDKDSIAQGQARLQQIIGQVPITKELTEAMLNLSVKTGSVEGAAQLLGRAIENSTTVLKRHGVTVEDSLDKQVRLKNVIDAVNGSLGGQAVAANQGLGGIKGLKDAFEEFEKALGEQFAPMVTTVIQKMTVFFQTLNENKALISFIANLIEAATAFAGITFIISSASAAFLELRAAMIAAGGAMELLSLGVKGLLSSTGIGLILVVIGELYMHWDVIWPAMVSIFKEFSENIGAMAAGVGKILIGALTMDKDFIVAGWDQLSEAWKKTWTNIKLKPIEAPAVDGTKQIASMKDLADKRTAEEARMQGLRIALAKAEREALYLEATQGSKELIDLKKREIATLKDLEKEKDAATIEALQDNLEKIQFLQEKAQDHQQKNAEEYRHDILQNDKQYKKMSLEDQREFEAQYSQMLIGTLEDEKQVQQRYALQEAQQQITAHNKFLLEQKKFGTAYATINKLMNSEIYEGSKKAFGDLAALQSSSNETLKGIGKVAAVANITIKTAESAMEIYAGFATIPIVGPALGIIGAAAAVAFGAEQIGQVMGAADGGLLTGGFAGRDSIPMLGMSGELVAPSHNFEEVIGSVRAAREAEKMGGGAGGGGMDVTIGFKDDAFQIIETKLLARRRTGVGVL